MLDESYESAEFFDPTARAYGVSGLATVFCVFF